MKFAAIAPVLRAVAMSAAAAEALDPLAVATELGRNPDAVAEDLHWLDAAGLIHLGDDEQGHVPLLLHAGHQYLVSRGDVGNDVLFYLPSVIDDLHARAALASAANQLTDEFREAVTNGQATSVAHRVVPPAFAGAVNESLAINLFAATVALTCRLGLQEAAGCLAEEIVAVELLTIARGDLEAQLGSGLLSADEAEHARDELRGLFELFEDADVLDLFDMFEPADAALAGHDSISQQMGKVDQRHEAWFQPFGGVNANGYYRPRDNGNSGGFLPPV
ncbi:MAG: hypothetical protein JWR63_1005 [Conexibacter sp.]|nr:hypothetical protein [Conexibacter sp.]